MKEGEYPSVRAAAVDAGIVKPRIQVTWKDGATPEQIATAILKKVSPELIGELVKWLEPIVLLTSPHLTSPQGQKIASNRSASGPK
jgi:hypothetical protein